MSGLRAVMDELGERVKARVDGLHWDGPDTNAHAKSSPRITWEPVRGAHQPPKRMGGGPKDDGALWTRRLRIEVVVWGERLEKTEELLQVFVEELHEVCTHHSYSLEGEEWATGGKMSKGMACALGVVLSIPFLRKKSPTRTLTDIVPTFTLGATTLEP